MADISKIKTRSNGIEYNIKDASAFRTGDTADTTIDNADTIPFYDTSATAKKKITVQNLKSAIGGSQTLAGLADTDILNPVDGQILQYDGTKNKWVNAIAGGVIPDGSTVTPVGDIAIWLHCANIWDKDYTSLSQVLADATTLLALVSNGNAVDYMVRSTSWTTDVCNNALAMTDIGSNDYCADTLLSDSTWRTAIRNSAYFESVLNVKIPAMTSNTTPSGVASGSSKSADARDFYFAFDGGTKTISSPTWNSQIMQSATPWAQYIQYMFPRNIKLYEVLLDNSPRYNWASAWSDVNYNIKVSTDGNSWTTLKTNEIAHYNSGNYSNTTELEGVECKYVRLEFNTYNVAYEGYYNSIYKIQMYGREAV